jgi:hypothetical protein
VTKSLGLAGNVAAEESMTTSDTHHGLSVPLRDCLACGGPAKMIATLPPARGTSSLAIFRCTLCGTVDWMTPQQLPIRSARARVKNAREFPAIRCEGPDRLRFAVEA